MEVKISPLVFVAHTQALQTSIAKYSIKTTVCNVFAILQNYGDVTFEKVVSGQLPMRLVVGLVSNVAFNGSKTYNRFNFGDDLYICAYNSLFSGTGKLNRDKGVDILHDDYKNGYMLYSFHLTADLREDDQPGETRKPAPLAKVRRTTSQDGDRTHLRGV